MDNIDYGTRAALISAALKQAREQEATPIPQMRMMGRWATGPTGGEIMNMGVRQALGSYSAGQREQELTALNDEQMEKFADISKQLATPGTKTLKRTLNALGAGQEGPTGPEVEEQVPLDYSDPTDLSMDNARRMGLASKMASLGLPQAQKVAQDYLSKGAAFPEALALLQTKQIEQGQQAAANRANQMILNRDRLESREETARLGRENTAAIAAGSQAIQQGRLDDQRVLAQEKRDAAVQKKQDAVNASISALAPIEASLAGLLSKPGKDGKRAITPELEAYTGNWDQYMPEAALKQSTVDAGKKLAALKDQITMINLAQAKQAVGQSFGSMQVKEWDKFVNTLSSLDRAQGKEQLSESLNYVDNYIKNHKRELQTALSAGTGGGSPVAPSGTPSTKVINGKTYVNVGEGRWEEQ